MIFSSAVCSLLFVYIYTVFDIIVHFLCISSTVSGTVCGKTILQRVSFQCVTREFSSTVSSTVSSTAYGE